MITKSILQPVVKNFSFRDCILYIPNLSTGFDYITGAKITGTFRSDSNVAPLIHQTSTDYRAGVLNQPRPWCFNEDNSWTIFEPTSTNYYPYSNTPSNRTVNVTTGSWTLSIYGSGSIAIAAGTAVGSGWGSATDGSPKTITIATAGTVTLTVTGSPTWAQLEPKTFASSYIANTGTGSTARASEASVASPSNGWRMPLTDMNSDVVQCLSAGGSGTLIFDLILGIDKAAIAAKGISLGIVSVRDSSSYSLWRIAGTTGDLYAHPAVEAAASLSTVSYAANTPYICATTWGNNSIEVWMNGSYGTRSPFTNGFTLNSYLNLMYNLNAPMWIKGLMMYPYKATSWAQILTMRG